MDLDKCRKMGIVKKTMREEFIAEFAPSGLVGNKYGMLTIVECGEKIRKKMLVKCLCDCGNTKNIILKYLIIGVTKSCGCLRNELSSKRNKTHGLSYTTEYRTWKGMISRCNDNKNKRWKDYGGRGIKVCQEWLNSVDRFVEDMGKKPTGCQIDRINNDGNYEPSNCRWVTPKQNALNKRDTVIINFLGQSKPIEEWADKFNMKKSTLSNRLDRGWSIERAMTTPAGKYTFNDRTNNKNEKEIKNAPEK